MTPTQAAHQTPPPFPPIAPPYPRWLVWLLGALGGAALALWTALTPPGLLGKADAVGYAICHRIAERSLHTHDRPLPLCARCTGTYLGVAAALIVLAARGRLRAAQLPPPRVLGALILLGLSYAADGLNSYLTFFAFYTPLYPPHNTLRLLTGAAFGLGLITVVLPVVNALAWAQPLRRAPIASLRELGGVVLAAGSACALALIEHPALRAALGVISAALVLGMFALIGAVLFLTITRHENTAQRWRDLLLPALAGLTFALILTGAIDLVRYALTGTWEGFALPG